MSGFSGAIAGGAGAAGLLTREQKLEAALSGLLYWFWGYPSLIPSLERAEEVERAIQAACTALGTTKADYLARYQARAV